MARSNLPLTTNIERSHSRNDHAASCGDGQQADQMQIDAAFESSSSSSSPVVSPFSPAAENFLSNSELSFDDGPSSESGNIFNSF